MNWWSWVVQSVVLGCPSAFTCAHPWGDGARNALRVAGRSHLLLLEAAYRKVMHEVNKGVTMNPSQFLKSFHNVLLIVAVLCKLMAETQSWGPSRELGSRYFLPCHLVALASVLRKRAMAPAGEGRDLGLIPPRCCRRVSPRTSLYSTPSSRGRACAYALQQTVPTSPLDPMATKIVGSLVISSLT